MYNKRAAILSNLWETFLGQYTLPAWVEAKLVVEPAQLEEWAERVLDVETLEAVLFE